MGTPTPHPVPATRGDRSIDPAYLDYQYGDAAKLRVRRETHDRYSALPNDAFFDWVVDQLDPRPGTRVLDVGCGPGTYQSRMARRRARIVAVDVSDGMLREALRVAPAGAAGTGDAPATRADRRESDCRPGRSP